MMHQKPLSDHKSNPGKYVAFAEQEDVFTTRHGKKAARLVSAKTDKVAAAKSLFGILPSDADLARAREKRLQ